MCLIGVPNWKEINPQEGYLNQACSSCSMPGFSKFLLPANVYTCVCVRVCMCVCVHVCACVCVCTPEATIN